MGRKGIEVVVSGLEREQLLSMCRSRSLPHSLVRRAKIVLMAADGHTNQANAEAQLYLKDNVHPEPVTDAQVKARYDELVAALGKEEFKPRIIVVPDAATATIVLAQLKSGQAFEALAREYSKAPSAAAGGELPWVSFKVPAEEGRTQGLPIALAKTIAMLPVGGVTSEPVILGSDSKGPVAIAKLDAKRPTQVPAFDQAKDTIRRQLQALALEKAAAQLTTGLMKGATIQQ